uniref:Uncharacterized protein n=1 Tax=Romanomermis culicivorax TaxID=13658 RepID=A0A915KWC0_ROMCU
MEWFVRKARLWLGLSSSSRSSNAMVVLTGDNRRPHPCVGTKKSLKNLLDYLRHRKYGDLIKILLYT